MIKAWLLTGQLPLEGKKQAEILSNMKTFCFSLSHMGVNAPLNLCFDVWNYITFDYIIYRYYLSCFFTMHQMNNQQLKKLSVSLIYRLPPPKGKSAELLHCEYKLKNCLKSKLSLGWKAAVSPRSLVEFQGCFINLLVFVVMIMDDGCGRVTDRNTRYFILIKTILKIS